MEWTQDETLVYDRMLGWYQELHRHPELGLQEHRTCKLIEDALHSIEGIEVRRPTETGVVATVRGSRPGRTIAFRADIDALPLQEETGCVWQSVEPGVMHACGHDGHVAMLLGAAAVLAARRDELAGEIRLLFQPAEEIGRGARELIEAGVLEGVEEVYAAHLDALHPTGTFGVREGPIMAASYTFTIEITGKGGHAAFPDQAIDSVYIAAQLIQALHGVISRKISPFHRAVITVSQLAASQAPNIIAEKVCLGGTIRVLDPACETLLFEQVEQLSQGICKLYGASCTLSVSCVCPILNNPPAETAYVSDMLKKTFGENAVYLDDAVLGGENFAEYLQELPGCYYKIGARVPNGAAYPHHNARFAFDPEALKYGLHACTTLLCDAVEAR